MIQTQTAATPAQASRRPTKKYGWWMIVSPASSKPLYGFGLEYEASECHNALNPPREVTGNRYTTTFLGKTDQEASEAAGLQDIAAHGFCFHNGITDEYRLTPATMPAKLAMRIAGNIATFNAAATAANTAKIAAATAADIGAKLASVIATGTVADIGAKLAAIIREYTAVSIAADKAADKAASIDAGPVNA